MNVLPYWTLMRFDKPVGIYLLWCPTAWALWVANSGLPSARLLLIFFAGSVIMRAAGCVINDIADRHIDKHVARTAARPLTSGQLSLNQALMTLFILLTAALGILLLLPWQCFYYALIALVITMIYPFCKRFIQAPQMVLGFAFSMGMPMVFIASGSALDANLMLLLAINFLWVISYDTMYAMTDRKDDLLIGVKSTAILFSSYDRLMIAVLQSGFHFLWFIWAVHSHQGMAFYSLWLLASFILLYQQKQVHQREPSGCFKAFKMNGLYGGMMWMALIAGFGIY